MAQIKCFFFNVQAGRIFACVPCVPCVFGPTQWEVVAVSIVVFINNFRLLICSRKCVCVCVHVGEREPYNISLAT